jgi:hypothetical protein
LEQDLELDLESAEVEVEAEAAEVLVALDAQGSRAPSLAAVPEELEVASEEALEVLADKVLPEDSEVEA